MDTSWLKTENFRTLVVLTAFFILLALLLSYVHVGQAAWDILMLSAIVWFVLEARSNMERLRNAMYIGVFLLLFDFIFENAGWLMGLWQTFSALHVGVVPLEVMALALFGGAAWAMYLPKKFNRWHSLVDCIVFAFFGMLGERLLIGQGLFVYNLWWNSALAFIAYFVTWVILHFIRYRVFVDKAERKARPKSR